MNHDYSTYVNQKCRCDICKSAHASYMRGYKLTRKDRRLLLKSKAIGYLGGKCVNCGSTDRLEFDHIDNNRGGRLSFMISAMIVDRKWETVVKELDKCQLLCRSCHQQKSLYERGQKPANIFNIGVQGIMR